MPCEQDAHYKNTGGEEKPLNRRGVEIGHIGLLHPLSWVHGTPSEIGEIGEERLEGKPTGIKREDLSEPHGVIYHGERATVVEIRDAGSGAELLLGFGDREVLLFGYFNDDDEFIHIEDPILH